MAKLDFPSSPSFGQTYPNPAVPGIPVYTWDLEKWVASGPVGSPPQAPFDAMAYSGMQINGGMEVSQENGTATTTVPNGAVLQYIVDGWGIQSSGTHVVFGFQQAAAPYIPPNFPNSLAMNITTPNPSPAAGDFCIFNHRIEGFRVARLGWGTASASPITIGFWIYSVRAGAYSGSIANIDFNRSYTFPISVNAPTTWEYKTVTIPGDTTGTWHKDNRAGMQFMIALMSGATYTAAAGSWTASGLFGVTGTFNGVAQASDGVLLSGVVILPGTQAPTAAQSPNIMRPFDQELVTCKRYWQKLGGGTGAYEINVNGYQTAGGYIAHSLSHIQMRAAPSGFYVGTWGNINTATTDIYPGPNSTTLSISAAATGSVAIYTTGATTYLALDARL